MKDLSLDWGQLIAYLIPGFVTVGAIALCDETMYAVMSAAMYQKDSAGAIVAILLFALAAGMIVSVARAALLDWSFALSRQRFPLFYLKSAVEPTWREEPNLTNIAAAGAMEVFREARAEDKRPYQFYGNLLVAVLLLAVAWPVGILRQHAVAPSILTLFIYSVLFVPTILALYSASRRSHFRYMREIRRLNDWASTRVPKSWQRADT